MKLNQMKILILSFFFHIILNYEKKIDLFKTISLIGENNFYYQFENTDLQENKDAYFFLNFMIFLKKILFK